MINIESTKSGWVVTLPPRRETKGNIIMMFPEVEDKRLTLAFLKVDTKSPAGLRQLGEWSREKEVSSGFSSRKIEISLIGGEGRWVEKGTFVIEGAQMPPQIEFRENSKLLFSLS